MVIVAGILLVATMVGCRSERAGSGAGADVEGVPPVPAGVQAVGPGVERCTDEILPRLMGEIGYQVIHSETSKAGCVVVLEAHDPPGAVQDHLATAAGELGYTGTGEVAAKGGQRLTYSGADGLAISILMRGEGPVTMQYPDAESHLELHWYEPSLL
ncbi:hypothetical protein [Luteimonas dalianensis]